MIMKKLLSSFSLALLLCAGAGVQQVSAQVTYTEIKSVDFSSDQAGYIPVGWTVNNEGAIRPGGTTYTDWPDNPGWAGGPRTMSVSNQNVLYIRAQWPEGQAAANEGYALYGDQAEYDLTLPAGNIEVRVPAALWTSGGTCKVGIDVLKYEASKELSELSTVASAVQGLTYVGKDTDLSGIEQATLRFENAAEGRYLIKVSAIPGDEGVTWTEIIFTGFSAYTYTGTPSKYDDPLTVFEEKFADTADNYAPAEGSGWTIYVPEDGNNADSPAVARTKGASYAGNGSRIFKLTGQSALTSAYYHQAYGYDARRYIIYGEEGEGEPKLTLAANTYVVSYDAAVWSGENVDTRVWILKSDGSVVDEHISDAIVGQISKKDGDGTPDHISYKVTIEEDGDYMLKISSNSQVLIGNIQIKIYDENAEPEVPEEPETPSEEEIVPMTSFTEDFSAAEANCAPGVGSGWTIYVPQDGNDASSPAVARTKGASYAGNGSRIFKLTGQNILTSAYYHQAYGYDARRYMIYGEDGKGEPKLYLEAGTYDVSFDAAIWKDEPDVRFIILDANRNEVDAHRTEALQNTLTLAGEGTPDHIAYQVTLPSTGRYFLKITSSGEMLIGNISLQIAQGATAIDALQQEAAAPQAIYDLQGRRVLRATTPGLYIMGGKKVMIR
jgi:hypothetical protein